MTIDITRVARAYALKNALSHGGKAVQGAVVAGLFAAGMPKDGMKEAAPIISQVLHEVNAMSTAEQEAALAEVEDVIGARPEREGLPELDAVGKKGVITRFAPSASGPLHIGHAIACCLNFLYVEKYGGTFYFRIEDTNPDNSFLEAYTLLEEDVRWLTKHSTHLKVIIQSERMEQYYATIEALLSKGRAYVCSCEGDAFRELISKKEACPCRGLPKKEQLGRWQRMLGGTDAFNNGEAVVRFASDLADKNPAMRDFPLARVNDHAHPRQKKKYRVWPLMNLAVTVDDIDLGVTHTIRGKDHRDNALRQEMIYAALGKEKKYPHKYFYGRIHFKDLDLSTTGMREAIASGTYSGWDDKRLPTLLSLRKRGYTPEAFWALTQHLGMTETDKTMDEAAYFELLDTFAKKSKH